ncbi:hypothetical protein ALC57_18754 [Trachymyrmex cornetzi]|uniref:Uncharacterized protein n=1 Tax=Trachymyrmex cornetzi TaxID=471704 RepID=A0A151IR28_9HYME|nr:hypothetical protein ALC57_18754 [Trachymyrmex cornetzi]
MRKGVEGCTLEEAVVVGRQWERAETLGLRKAEDTGEEESCEGGTEGGGERDRAESERRIKYIESTLERRGRKRLGFCSRSEETGIRPHFHSVQTALGRFRSRIIGFAKIRFVTGRMRAAVLSGLIVRGLGNFRSVGVAGDGTERLSVVCRFRTVIVRVHVRTHVQTRVKHAVSACKRKTGRILDVCLFVYASLYLSFHSEDNKIQNHRFQLDAYSLRLVSSALASRNGTSQMQQHPSTSDEYP